MWRPAARSSPSGSPGGRFRRLPSARMSGASPRPEPKGTIWGPGTARSGRRLRSISAHAAVLVRSLTFSPDGRLARLGGIRQHGSGSGTPTPDPRSPRSPGRCELRHEGRVQPGWAARCDSRCRRHGSALGRRDLGTAPAHAGAFRICVGCGLQPRRAACFSCVRTGRSSSRLASPHGLPRAA